MSHQVIMAMSLAQMGFEISLEIRMERREKRISWEKVILERGKKWSRGRSKAERGVQGKIVTALGMASFFDRKETHFCSSEKRVLWETMGLYR